MKCITFAEMICGGDCKSTGHQWPTEVGDMHKTPESYKDIGNKAGYDTAPNKNEKIWNKF